MVIIKFFTVFLYILLSVVLQCTFYILTYIRRKPVEHFCHVFVMYGTQCNVMLSIYFYWFDFFPWSIEVFCFPINSDLSYRSSFLLCNRLGSVHILHSTCRKIDTSKQPAAFNGQICEWKSDSGQEWLYRKETETKDENLSGASYFSGAAVARHLKENLIPFPNFCAIFFYFIIKIYTNYPHLK